MEDAPEAVVAVPSVRPGTSVTWWALEKGMNGPSLVLDSFVDLTSGRTWLLVNWHGALHLIADTEVCWFPNRRANVSGSRSKRGMPIPETREGPS